jgi:hypothetical protein
MSLREAESLMTGPATYDLEGSTKQLLADQKKRLMTPSTEELLQGVGTPGSGLLTPAPTYDFSVGLGGQAASEGTRVADAISGRNQRRSEDYINTLKNELKLTAPARDAKNVRMVGQNMARESEVALNNNRIRKQYDLDKKRLEQYKQQQKDSILASVLGVIGTIGGVALGVATGGAGFAGMAAASALGGAAGKAASNFTTTNMAPEKGPSLFK